MIKYIPDVVAIVASVTLPAVASSTSPDSVPETPASSIREVVSVITSPCISGGGCLQVFTAEDLNTDTFGGWFEPNLFQYSDTETFVVESMTYHSSTVTESGVSLTAMNSGVYDPITPEADINWFVANSISHTMEITNTQVYTVSMVADTDGGTSPIMIIDGPEGDTVYTPGQPTDVVLQPGEYTITLAADADYSFEGMKQDEFIDFVTMSMVTGSDTR